MCLGGGYGMPKAVLGGLKSQDVDISVVCAMLDSGGSSGRLRSDYSIRAPGDLRRAIISLANTSPVMEKIFDYRFNVGELEGHNFANLLIMALELNSENYIEAVDELKKMLNVEHKILPVTLDRSNLRAELEDGTIIQGETNIDRPQHDDTLKIRDITLEPSAKAYEGALSAIREADLIIIGPGDLYSTIAQIMKVEGITEEICRSKAQKIYLVNLMTKKGETNNFSVKEFSNQIESWLGCKLDKVIYSLTQPTQERLSQYLSVHPELIEMVKVDNNLDPRKFLGADLIYDDGPIEHDTQKVSNIIKSLL